MTDHCPTCGGPRQSFYIAGYEKAQAKYEARVKELEAALERIANASIVTYQISPDFKYVNLSDFEGWQEAARIALKGGNTE